jgi:hypothetical protein
LSEKIVLENPDGSTGQLHTDGNGNLLVSPANILGSLTAPPVGKVINSIAFTWNADGTLATAVFKDNASPTPNILFTLTFGWTSGQLTSIVRS